MLDNQTKRALKARAHNLNPIVMIGAKGLTEAVIEELNAALLAHELVKIKITADDKASRRTIIATITDKLDAELIQSIGHTATIFRPKPLES